MPHTAFNHEGKALEVQPRSDKVQYIAHSREGSVSSQSHVSAFHRELQDKCAIVEDRDVTIASLRTQLFKKDASISDLEFTHVTIFSLGKPPAKSRH